jgi:hypothetical protein
MIKRTLAGLAIGAVLAACGPSDASPSIGPELSFPTPGVSPSIDASPSLDPSLEPTLEPSLEPSPSVSAEPDPASQP